MRTSTAGGLKGGIPSHIKARIQQDKTKLISQQTKRPVFSQISTPTANTNHQNLKSAIHDSLYQMEHNRDNMQLSSYTPLSNQGFFSNRQVHKNRNISQKISKLVSTNLLQTSMHAQDTTNNNFPNKVTSREASLITNSMNDPYQNIYVTGGNHPMTSRLQQQDQLNHIDIIQNSHFENLNRSVQQFTNNGLGADLMHLNNTPGHNFLDEISSKGPISSISKTRQRIFTQQ